MCAVCPTSSPSINCVQILYFSCKSMRTQFVHLVLIATTWINFAERAKRRKEWGREGGRGQHITEKTHHLADNLQQQQQQLQRSLFILMFVWLVAGFVFVRESARSRQKRTRHVHTTTMRFRVSVFVLYFFFPFFFEFFVRKFVEKAQKYGFYFPRIIASVVERGFIRCSVAVRPRQHDNTLMSHCKQFH